MGFRDKARTLSVIMSQEFGTPVVIEPVQVKSALDRMKGSEPALNLAIPYVQSITNQLGLSTAIQEGACKRLKRIFYKAIAKHDGNINEVPDVARFRLLIKGPDDIEAIRRYFLGQNPTYYKDERDKEARKGALIDLRKHPTNQITVEEFEDFYHVPSSTGRMALHIKLNVKIGTGKNVRVEVQVLHEKMVGTEELTRSNYLEAQKIIRRAERAGRTDNMTNKEKAAIEAYDSSSRERYFADAITHGLIDLRRPDLKTQAYAEIRRRAFPLRLTA